MSEFLMQGRHFTINHVWFENAQNFPFGNQYDILVIHGNPDPCEKIGKHRCKSELQRTCISDLTKSEEELLHLLHTNIRNHINRCNRENVKVNFYQDEASISAHLNDFAAKYHEMFEAKGRSDRFLPLDELILYAKHDSLLLSTAEIDEQIVQYHSYIIDHHNARCLYGCSHFRSVDKQTAQAIGRANDYLHWMDMLYCKQLGIKEYDWGGISSFENPNGIDKYKMKFGVEFREYYNITCRCSFRSKVVYQIKHLLGKA